MGQQKLPWWPLFSGPLPLWEFRSSSQVNLQCHQGHHTWPHMGVTWLQVAPFRQAPMHADPQSRPPDAGGMPLWGKLWLILMKYSITHLPWGWGLTCIIQFNLYGNTLNCHLLPLESHRNDHHCNTFKMRKESFRCSGTSPSNGCWPPNIYCLALDKHNALFYVSS